MRRVASLVALLMMALAPLAAAQAPRTYILQNAATATGGGTVAHALGYTVATVQVTVPTGASPHFTVEFEQSLNNVHYTATRCTPLSGGAAHTGVTVTPASAATAALHWRCNVTGSLWFRSRITSYTGGGAVTVYATLMSSGTHTAATMAGPRWS